MHKRLLLFFTMLFAFTNLLFAQQKLKAIKAERLIDVVNGTVLTNQIILISNDTIINVGAGLTIPAGTEIIDLSNATVLPGLIDCHTHLTAQPGNDYYGDIFRKTPIDYAITAHLYAQRTLEAGFTTCRDVGAQAFIDVALRSAINKDEIPGPRMVVATMFIGATGSLAPQLATSLSSAIKANLKIAYGTDAGVFPHGFNAMQFAYFVKNGLTPMQAIQTATVNAADLLGWTSKVGSITKGKLADIIAVTTNPLDDITVLENVQFVMKGGVVYKHL